MQKCSLKHESKLGLLACHWFAAALSAAVLLAPVASPVQTIDVEIVDLEQEECSVEVAEGTRNERQRRESLCTRVAHPTVFSVQMNLGSQLRSRVSERDSLNGIGGWLTL
jgi:hypothetical protein